MEAIKKDELFDDELRGMVKFTDATTKPTQPVKADKKTANKEPTKKKKRHLSQLRSQWTQNTNQLRHGMMQRP